MRQLSTIIMIMVAATVSAQSYEELFEQATQELKEERYAQAESLYLRAIAREPSHRLNEYAYSNLAFAQWTQGKAPEAIASYTKALALSPQSTQIMLQRARIYVEQGIIDSALVDYSNVLTTEPRNSHALFMRAYIYGQKEEYTKAYADYNALLAIEPSNNDARLSLALLYHKAGRLNDALMLLGVLIDGNPQNAEYYYARSNVHRKENLAALALMDIEKAIELAPQSAAYHIAHAQLLLDTGDRRAARKALDQAVASGEQPSTLVELYKQCSEN